MKPVEPMIPENVCNSSVFQLKLIINNCIYFRPFAVHFCNIRIHLRQQLELYGKYMFSSISMQYSFNWILLDPSQPCFYMYVIITMILSLIVPCYCVIRLAGQHFICQHIIVLACLPCYHVNRRCCHVTEYHLTLFYLIAMQHDIIIFQCYYILCYYVTMVFFSCQESCRQYLHVCLIRK